MNPAEQIPPPAYFGSLTIENVKCFKGKHEIDLSDGNGKPAMWTVILGNNNTGKTTLLRCLADLEPKLFHEDWFYLPKFSSSNRSIKNDKNCLIVIGSEILFKIADDFSQATVVEINSETDFVAQNDGFKNLVLKYFNSPNKCLATLTCAYEDDFISEIKSRIKHDVNSKILYTINIPIRDELLQYVFFINIEDNPSISIKPNNLIDSEATMSL